MVRVMFRDELVQNRPRTDPRLEASRPALGIAQNELSYSQRFLLLHSFVFILHSLFASSINPSIHLLLAYSIRMTIDIYPELVRREDLSPDEGFGDDIDADCQVCTVNTMRSPHPCFLRRN